MRCKECGKVVARCNHRLGLCFSCQDEIDDWSEMTTLPSELHRTKKEDITDQYPPPMEEEILTRYVRRLLTDADDAIPVYAVCRAHGFESRRISQAVSKAKVWFGRRGIVVRHDEHYGHGYRLVREGE